MFIDWDGAGPGTRLWDLSYAIHGFAPLSPAAGYDDRTLSARVSVLVEGYRLEAAARKRLLELLVPRIRSMHLLLAEGHRSGRLPWGVCGPRATARPGQPTRSTPNSAATRCKPSWTPDAGTSALHVTAVETR